MELPDIVLLSLLLTLNILGTLFYCLIADFEHVIVRWITLLP